MMHRLRRALPAAAALLCLSALGAPGHAALSRNSGPGGPITLNFNWPAGMHSRVHSEWLATRKGDGDLERIMVEWRYRMTTQQVGPNLLVNAKRVTSAIYSLDSRRRVNPVRKFLMRKTTDWPGQLVSADGRLITVQGLPAYRESILTGLEKVFRSLPKTAMAKRIRNVFVEGITEENLKAHASAYWDILASWSKMRLQRGEPQEFAVRVPFSELNFARVPMQGTLLFKGWTNCSSQSNKRCVELLATIKAGAAETAGAVKSFLQEYPGMKKDYPIARVTRSERMHVICDPASLLPYQTRSRTKTAVYMEGEGSPRIITNDRRVRYAH